MPETPTHPNWTELVEDGALPVQVLASRDLTVGKRTVRTDRLQMPSGHQFEELYRPRGPEAVFVLPVTPDGQVVLLREYRHPVRMVMTGTVAGTLEDGEEIFPAAVRELREEAGGVAGEWVALPAFYPNASFSGAVYYAFIAFDVQLGEANLMPDETIERLVLPAPEAYRRLRAGEIHDAPSSLVMWHALSELQRRGFLA
ncbi:NUDIX hydrolase [Deinococcus cavernae]|uniref:NUDIX hydrolase n=1 Tax=Deinococcus cavernae TaxID=2320857 RepID=A0A418VAY2_9DEIO|nr:NUDIX hydrolase [Deinococcus cavernae]RJF73209.1 NUDIX hydrolase [Deinococcus cavernae]